MYIERSMHEQFLSNTYLVASGGGAGGAGGVGPEALFIDAGGPVEPLIASAERLRLAPSHVLLTHHHFDHVCEAGRLRERWPEIEVLCSATERELLAEGPATGVIEGGASLNVGELLVRAFAVPGHTAGMLCFHISEPGAERRAMPAVASEVASEATAQPALRAESPGGLFTGDTLFKGSIGGVRAPGHSTYADLKRSIMETLMAFEPDTVIYPGHADPTTVAAEWEGNGFIRLWRGLDREQPRACKALGEPARLILLAVDYDGGRKAWVRWPDGSDDVLPGSRVEVL